MNFPSQDQLLETAAQFLMQGNEHNAASVLLSCSIEQGQHRFTRGSTDEFDITLRCSRDIFEQLQPRGGNHGFDEYPPLMEAIRQAIQAALPSGGGIANLEARAALVQLSPDWKVELLQIARGIDVHNQAVDAKAAWTWNNLRFRSASET